MAATPIPASAGTTAPILPAAPVFSGGALAVALAEAAPEPADAVPPDTLPVDLEAVLTATEEPE